MAGFGRARRGRDRRGAAWLGRPRSGRARRGTAWLGTPGRGSPWQGKAWHRVARYSRWVADVKLMVGDVRDRLTDLPDGSVDLIVTSPPFLALRSYLPPGHPDKDREIGS